MQRHRVPFYWLIGPEDRALIAHHLDGDNYRIIATVAGPGLDEQRVRIPPFEDVELHLGYIPGE